MRKNILIVCYNYALSRRVASVVAERLDMRSFDMYEMFKFNNAPNTLEEILKINGKDFVDKKMRSVLKSELDFLGVVFVADAKVLLKNEDLFVALKETNNILLLKNDFKTEFSQRENISFLSDVEKDYFSFELDELFDAEKFLEAKLADFVVDLNNLSYSQIIDAVFEGLSNLNNNL